MVTITRLACGEHSEDSLSAVKLDDGTVALEYRAQDGRWTRYVVAPDDTLRISSEIWGKQRPNMETELVIVSRTGFSTDVAHFECGATSGGVHANEVGEFASAVADASGCGVNVLPRAGPTRAWWSGAPGTGQWTSLDRRRDHPTRAGR